MRHSGDDPRRLPIAHDPRGDLWAVGFGEDGAFAGAVRVTSQLVARLEGRGQDLLVSAHPTAASHTLILYLVRSH